MNNDVKIVEDKNVFAHFVVEDNTIVLNPDIKNNPKLYKEIVEHEFAHANSEKLLDVKEELKGILNIPHQFRVTYFLLTHPSLILKNILPVFKYKGDWHINYFMCVFYSLAFIVGLISGGVF